MPLNKQKKEREREREREKETSEKNASTKIYLPQATSKQFETHKSIKTKQGQEERERA